MHNFLVIFFFKIAAVFFKVKQYINHINRNGWSDWREIKVNCIDSILGKIYSLDLWPHSRLGPWIFKVKVWNSLIIFDLVDITWKWRKSIEYWADYVTLPFDHTHDLGLKFGIAFSWEWEDRLTWNENDVNRHDHGFWWPWWDGWMYGIITLGLYSLRRRRLTGIGIPIINLRRSDDRLRFIIGIPILIRRRLLSE